ncbi:RNA recognition motif-containing protein [Besnoitia besnoiti]|uniref:RNA recognition motif-containing protein n=1 Tax=Besnoitia besnoiti TaxID=94643 RepID=A0A2A9MD99_BESBE|nr:RNA recognition motif-containing protein [Besnoitia besnoiti]PFH35859.1 RNA recognition motif-containing protein [Besnoitia besnoiti]
MFHASGEQTTNPWQSGAPKCVAASDDFWSGKREWSGFHDGALEATTHTPAPDWEDGAESCGSHHHFDDVLESEALESARSVSSDNVGDFTSKPGVDGVMKFLLPPPGFEPVEKRALETPDQTYSPFPFVSSYHFPADDLKWSRSPKEVPPVEADPWKSNSLLHFFPPFGIAKNLDIPAYADFESKSEDPGFWRSGQSEQRDASTFSSTGDSGLSSPAPQEVLAPVTAAAADANKSPALAPETPEKADDEERPPGVKVFFGNMATSTEEEMYEIFRPFGECWGLVLLRDRRQRPRGAGFVTFKREEDAQRAIEALDHKYPVRGATKPLEVRRPENAEQKKERIRLLAQMRSQLAAQNRRDAVVKPGRENSGSAPAEAGESNGRRRRRGQRRRQARTEGRGKGSEVREAGHQAGSGSRGGANVAASRASNALSALCALLNSEDVRALLMSELGSAGVQTREDMTRRGEGLGAVCGADVASERALGQRAADASRFEPRASILDILRAGDRQSAAVDGGDVQFHGNWATGSSRWTASRGPALSSGIRSAAYFPQLRAESSHVPPPPVSAVNAPLRFQQQQPFYGHRGNFEHRFQQRAGADCHVRGYQATPAEGPCAPPTLSRRGDPPRHSLSSVPNESWVTETLLDLFRVAKESARNSF